jgi:hypothetical protein
MTDTDAGDIGQQVLQNDHSGTNTLDTAQYRPPEGKGNNIAATRGPIRNRRRSANALVVTMGQKLRG